MVVSVNLVTFFKALGCVLIKLIRSVVVSYIIWMIWRMRNYAKFQKDILLQSTINTIKGYVRLTDLVGLR